LKKILITKIGAIGDVVMALPMVDAIRSDHPDSQITWVCGKTSAPLLQRFTDVDIILRVNEKHLFGAGLLGRLIALISIWIRLFSRSYDLILIGHGDRRYRALTLFCRSQKQRQFERNTSKRFPVPNRWHANEYIRLYTNIDGPGATFAVLPKPDVELSAEVKALINPDKKKIALTPGGARNSLRYDPLRLWPIESYAALARKLNDQGYEVVVTGAESDQWVSDHFSGVDVVNLVGKTDLLDLVALYQNCDGVVTHDSGPMHLAALSGTKVWALFGPTNPNEKAGYPNVHVIWGGKNLACRPCYDGINYADCSDSRCLSSIAVETVLNAVQSGSSDK